jgi:hypothetical protein
MVVGSEIRRSLATIPRFSALQTLDHPVIEHTTQLGWVYLSEFIYFYSPFVLLST